MTHLQWKPGDNRVLEYDPVPGTKIETAAQEMCGLAMYHDKPVKMVFNYIKLFVKPGDRPKKIVRYFIREMNRYCKKQRAKSKGKP